MGLARKWDPMPSTVKVKDWSFPRGTKPRTGAWRRFREALRLARGVFRCEACGVIEDHLEAHHVIPITADPTREYDPNNIRFLCRRCHSNAHGKDMRSPDSVR
jgi:5-methylcytosine-specific restriction endonuclease McrA